MKTTTTTTTTAAASTFISGIAKLEGEAIDLCHAYHLHIVTLDQSEWQAEFDQLATSAHTWEGLPLAAIAQALSRAVGDSQEGGAFGRGAFRAICEKLQGDYTKSNAATWSRAKSSGQTKATGKPKGTPSRKPTAKEQAQAILAKLEGRDDVRKELVKLILAA